MLLLRAPINLHNCAAFSISHPNLSPLSLSHSLLLRFGIITHRILHVLTPFRARNVRCKADFVELQEAPPPSYVLLHTNADKLKAFLSFLLLFNRVVLPLFPHFGPQSKKKYKETVPAFACFIGNWRQSENVFDKHNVAEGN